MASRCGAHLHLCKWSEPFHFKNWEKCRRRVFWHLNVFTPWAVQSGRLIIHFVILGAGGCDSAHLADNFRFPRLRWRIGKKNFFWGEKFCHVMDSFELISTFVKLVNTDPPIVWNGSRWRRCFDPKRQVSRQQEIIWMKWGTRASRWLAFYHLAHQKDTRAVQQMENSSGKCARPQRNNKRPKRSDEPPSVSSSRGLSS